jgi:hypothetical protein
VLVVQLRLPRQVGSVRRRPRLDHVIAERLPPAVDRDERPKLLPSPDLGAECDSVALPVEGLRSIPVTLPPPDPPTNRSALQDTPLDLYNTEDVTTSRCVLFGFDRTVRSGHSSLRTLGPGNLRRLSC